MANDSTVLSSSQKTHVSDALEHDAEVMRNTQLSEQLAGQRPAVREEIIRINTDARPRALQVALLTGQEKMAELLVARGADVRIEQAEGFTALHEAAQIGSETVVKLLLDAGANPSARAKDGRTPLGIARKERHEAVARLLESRGARG